MSSYEASNTNYSMDIIFIVFICIFHFSQLCIFEVPEDGEPQYSGTYKTRINKPRVYRFNGILERIISANVFNLWDFFNKRIDFFHNFS